MSYKNSMSAKEERNHRIQSGLQIASDIKQERLAERATKIFEHLLALLGGTPPLSASHLKYELIGGSKSSSALEADNQIPDYQKSLITQVATLIHQKIMSSVDMGRRVDTTTATDNIKIKFHGGSVIENAVFGDCLSSMTNYEKVFSTTHKIFSQIIIMRHPVTQDAITRFLKMIVSEKLYAEVSLDSAVNSNSLRLDATITNKNVTDHMVISLFICHLLREFMLEALPTTWVALKLNTSHVDYIVSSKDDNGISFTGVHDDTTEYRHVYYRGFKNDETCEHDTIRVASNGMFSVEKLSMILAQRHYFLKVVVISWQDLKDKAAFDASNL